MNIRTVNFKEYYNSAFFTQRFCRTRPVSFTFFKKEYKGSNWTDLYVKFFETVYARYPKKIEDLAFSSLDYGIRSGLFINKEGKKDVTFRRLGCSKICLITGYNVKKMLENIAETIRYLELDESEIMIQFADKKEIGLVSNLKYKTLSQYDNIVNQDSNFTGGEFLKFKGYRRCIADKYILSVLRKNYTQGFRFDDTTLALFEAKVGYALNRAEEDELKNIMYCREDSVWFLNESVATRNICLRIAKSANEALRKFMFFELNVLYQRFVGELNPVCIRNIEDFEKWFGDNFSGNIKITNLFGTYRIVRVKSISKENSIMSLLCKIRAELEKSFGTLEEDALLTIFSMFSIKLLNDLVQKEADDIIVCQINGRTCFQMFDALGLPEEFVEKLSSILIRIDELELKPSLDVINALLSFAFDYNFRNYFNIPNDQVYRRLIETYYQGTMRVWKAGLFKEIEE